MAEAEDTLLAKPVEDMADMKELLLSILKPEHRSGYSTEPFTSPPDWTCFVFTHVKLTSVTITVALQTGKMIC